MTSLDAAIVAYREDPSEANRRRLLAEQAKHTAAFQHGQSSDFIRRTT